MQAMEKESPFQTSVSEYEEWFKKNDKLFASELEAIRQILPCYGKGIEIGVGTGIFAAELGVRYGVEPSEIMRNEAIKKSLSVKNGVAEALPEDDCTFDFAMMITVDCFLEDILKAFSEVWRILVDDGLFIIAFLDRATKLGKLYEKNKHKQNSYKNANFHTSDEISALLEAAGFKIIDKRQTVYSLENRIQAVDSGVGQGLFAVIKAQKVDR